MRRLLPLAVLSAALAATAPALAKDDGPYYRAELAQPADNQVIAGGVLWMCEGTQCFAGKGTRRPEVMCKQLVKETSAVVRFSYAGEELAPEDLARCNA